MFAKVLNILNDMSPRQLLILSGAMAALMFAVIFAALNFLTETPEVVVEEQPEKPPVETSNVVVAKFDIQPRTFVDESMVELKELTLDSVPNGALTETSAVLHKMTRDAILAGDVVTDRKLYSNIAEAGFVGAIPPDCRAVSINVNDITGVAGFAKPGERVDLALIESESGRVTTSIILQDVLLLSINQDMNDSRAVTQDADGNQTANTGPISNPSIATFALRPDEAMQLVAATKIGEIYLMLRPMRPSEGYVDSAKQSFLSTSAARAAAEAERQRIEAERQRAAEAERQRVEAERQRALERAYLERQNAPVTAMVPPSPVNASVPSPVVPSQPEAPKPKKFEIIQGDQIVQKSDDTN